MRTVAVVTGARSDWGIYLPILRTMAAEPRLRVRLLVTSMHLSPEFGHTVDAIAADGFEVSERVEMLLSSDSPAGLATSIGLGTIGFGQAYSRQRPDLLLVLGDRAEMLAAATAALPFALPIAHVHGGESTVGAIDEAIRHAITKMSHLHFVSTETYARRVIQMGEQPWRVTVSGAPSLDNIRTLPTVRGDELAASCGVAAERPFLLVTYNPVTLEYTQTEFQVRELLAALEKIDLDVVFTYPNADTGGRQILDLVRTFAAGRAGTHVLASAGTAVYFELMRRAAAMVGNSSSGLIEAPSFRLPVVNIGIRQHGRVRAANVIDCAAERGEILESIRRAVSEEFRAQLHDLVSPYGDGRAAERIVRVLVDTPLDERLLLKRFHDLPGDRS